MTSYSTRPSSAPDSPSVLRVRVRTTGQRAIPGRKHSPDRHSPQGARKWRAVALAWLLAQKPWMVPIPGTRNPAHLQENLGAVDVQLTSADLRDLETSLSGIRVQGVACPRST